MTDVQPGPSDSPEVEDLVSVVSRFSETHLETLKQLSARTRIQQAEYWREGVGMLLNRYRENSPPEFSALEGDGSLMKATHFMLPSSLNKALDTTRQSTRKKKADLLREALFCILTKYVPALSEPLPPGSPDTSDILCPCGNAHWAAVRHKATRVLWLRCSACGEAQHSDADIQAPSAFVVPASLLSAGVSEAA